MGPCAVDRRALLAQDRMAITRRTESGSEMSTGNSRDPERGGFVVPRKLQKRKIYCTVSGTIPWMPYPLNYLKSIINASVRIKILEISQSSVLELELRTNLSDSELSNEINSLIKADNKLKNCQIRVLDIGLKSD
jgi:hypothetical protein